MLKTIVELILRQMRLNTETLGRELVEKVTVFYEVLNCQCSAPISELAYRKPSTSVRKFEAVNLK